MLNIKVTVQKHKYSLELQGHCGAGAQGNDLVCCACSTLCLALGRIVRDNVGYLTETPTVIMKKGYAFIEFQPSEECEAVMFDYFYAIITGFEELKDLYPEYINF